MQLTLASCPRKALGAVAEQPPRRHPIYEPDKPAAGVLHLEHLTATLAELLDHRTGQILRNVDGDLLIRLLPLPILRPQDDARPRDREFVALATHGLHQ